MSKQKISESEAKIYIDKHKQRYIKLGYEEEKAESWAYCDLQQRYEIEFET